ncbi:MULTISPECIES: ribonuclease M5 [Holzapfeliella]
MTEFKIEEVVVVEGKDDIKRLNLYFPGIKTIQTQGSAISDSILDQIETAYHKTGVIVLTDPDFNGEKIRKKILERLPKAKQAFLPRDKAVPQKSGGSLGIEHASKASLLEALKGARLTQQLYEPEVSRHDLIEHGLVFGPNARFLREQLGNQLKIGYGNAKQLEKKCATFQITKEEFENAMQKVKEKYEEFTHR